MTAIEAVKAQNDRIILNGEEWLTADFRVDKKDLLLGTPEMAILRPHTKNFVLAPEKAFKTTFLLRLSLGLTIGETVFPSLPVHTPHRLLYLHGELAPAEVQERFQEAAKQLPRPLDNFIQGRSMTASLVTQEGHNAIRGLVKEYTPEILVIDPWQSFIAGADENSFKEMSVATDFIDHLIFEHDLTVIIAIHSGKDPSKGPRGHSSLSGWRDTQFVLRKKGTSLTVEVDPRWAKAPKPITLKFGNGTLWEGDGPAWTKQEETIRALLLANDGQLSREEIGLGLELKGGSLRMALKRAQDSKAVEVDGGIIRLAP